MAAIKLHVETEELVAVKRLADALKVRPDDVAYTALHRLMLESGGADVRAEILRVRDWRRNTLPQWSDTAHSVHVYESLPDEQQHPRTPAGGKR
jgi:hypothetical protein